jgi:hypothetical protein
VKRARRRIRLIAPVDANAPVSNYAVEGLTTALERIGMRLVRSDPRAVTALGRRLARAGLTRRYLGRAPAYFRVLMGPSAALCFPRGLLHEIIPYCFDCVPPNYQDWKRLFQRYRISLAFFSAQQALAAMSELVPDLSAHWVPEAVDPSEYSRGDRLATRSIHILELGRR